MGIFNLFDDKKDNKKEKDEGFFSFLNEKDNENESGYTEEELDSYGLEEWQKEEVKKGKADPWNFEEEDLEDDDYYYDDKEEE